jgi:nucleotide-binding universal stress UspA family protein
VDIRIKQILVPTDLSTFGASALRFAEIFREKLGASALAMFVNEPIYPVADFAASLGVAWNGEDIRLSLESELRDFVAKTVKEPAVYDMRVVDGYPARTILDTAKATHTDLIIMGTHGRTGWRRTLLGSVTEQVLRESDIPLLTVNATTATAQRVAIESILCPVNFSTVAHDALRYASYLAAKFGAELTVMSVEEDYVSSDLSKDFEGWVDDAVRKQCTYKQLVMKGGAAESVLEAANQARTDLIVIGAQHKRFSDATVIGSTTERLTRFAWQPVLTVIRKPVERSAEVAA